VIDAVIVVIKSNGFHRSTRICAEIYARAHTQDKFEFLNARMRRSGREVSNFLIEKFEFKLKFRFKNVTLIRDTMTLENIQYTRLNEMQIRIEGESELVSGFNVEYFVIEFALQNFYCSM